MEDFAARLRRICQEVNANHDVESLCKEFPTRLQSLVDAKGDHIGK